MSSTISELIPRISKRIKSETAYLDAQVLLGHILKRPRSWIAAHPEIELEPVQLAELQDAMQQLDTGTPLPYVLGHWEFFGLEFDISPDVLIPRPETELLIEKALGWLKANPTRRRAADVGTGSGCIPITLATHFSDLHVLATDISNTALKIAQQNAVKHNVAERIGFQQSNLFSSKLEDLKPFDLITANLPYIPTRTLHGLAVFNREPSLALDGGADGLDLIRRLFTEAPTHLKSGSMMLLEFEATQGKKILKLARETFPQANILLHTDLAGHDRLLEILLLN